MDLAKKGWGSWVRWKRKESCCLHRCLVCWFVLLWRELLAKDQVMVSATSWVMLGNHFKAGNAWDLNWSDSRILSLPHHCLGPASHQLSLPPCASHCPWTWNAVQWPHVHREPLYKNYYFDQHKYVEATEFRSYYRILFLLYLKLYFNFLKK